MQQPTSELGSSPPSPSISQARSHLEHHGSQHQWDLLVNMLSSVRRLHAILRDFLSAPFYGLTHSDLENARTAAQQFVDATSMFLSSLKTPSHEKASSDDVPVWLL